MGLLLQRNPYLQEPYFITYFIAGLKDYIKTPVKAHDPHSLVQAYSHARIYETTAVNRKPFSDYSRYMFRPNTQSQAKQGYQLVKKETMEKPVNYTMPASKPVFDKTKCFKCVPGHNRVCKFKNTMHLLTVDTTEEDETDDTEEQTETPQEKDDSPELHISMHALSGTMKTGKTFPLFLKVGNVSATTLVDTGSTTTFMDPSIVTKAKLEVQNHEPIKVTVANGETLWTPALTKACDYSIQGHKFSSDFRILELKGYDIVLGCDWIYDYSPVGLDLKKREFTIQKMATLLSSKMKLYQTPICSSVTRK